MDDTRNTTTSNEISQTTASNIMSTGRITVFPVAPRSTVETVEKNEKEEKERRKEGGEGREEKKYISTG